MSKNKGFGTHTVLLLAADPSDAQRIDYSAEVQQVKDALEGTEFVTELKLETQPKDFGETLLLYRPKFVHFCGHGRSEEGIILQDESGKQQSVGTAELADLFSLFAQDVECVMLNACYSELQAKEISLHIDYVIGMKRQIGDEAARRFATAFYKAVGQGEEIDFAFRYACKLVGLYGLGQHMSPMLHKKSYDTKPIQTQIGLNTIAEDQSQPQGSKRGIVRSLDSIVQSEEATQTKDALHHLLDTIENEREVLIILGEGVSLAGKRRGENYPSFQKIIDEILFDNGYAPADNQQRTEAFRRILDRWEMEEVLKVRANKYIHGSPSHPHYYLCALMLAMLNSRGAPLFLSSTYDNIIARALIDLEPAYPENPTQIFDLPDYVSYLEDFISDIETFLRSNSPVLIRMYGGLNKDYQSNSAGQKLARSIEDCRDFFARFPAIFIGCDLRDTAILNLALKPQRRRPVFIVGPLSDIPRNIKNSPFAHLIGLDFQSTILDISEMIESRRLSICREVSRSLRFIDPICLFSSIDALRHRAGVCSNISLSRIGESLPQREGISPLVPRPDTAPEIESFINDNRPLLGIVGDSGTGKTTFLHQMTQNTFDDRCLYLVYDVHCLQGHGALSKKLAHDFHCSSLQVDRLLETFGRTLAREKQTLIIAIDGINESIAVAPGDIKGDIEELGARLPKEIKVIYTCRRVYWNVYISPLYRFPSSIYFQSKPFVLGNFSTKESKDAFLRYREVYAFIGEYNGLRNELKEKIRDPLMLQMMAKGYSGKKLPDFAPAVLIFDSYIKNLQDRYAATTLITFLEVLIELKLRQAEEGSDTTDQFTTLSIRSDETLRHLIIQQQTSQKMPGDPVTLLEDEGILTAIDPGKSTYRFSYDRFYEYLLGKKMGSRWTIYSAEEFAHWLSATVSTYETMHFSLLQALKSEIVRRSIVQSREPWSFHNPKTIASLLNPSLGERITNFTKDVLRELVFESEENFFRIIDQAIPEKVDTQYLLLEIAGDSPEIQPVLIDGIFSGDKRLAKKCFEILLLLCEAPSFRKKFDDLFFDIIKNTDVFSREHANGMIYYFSLKLHSGGPAELDRLSSIRDDLARILFLRRHESEHITNICSQEFLAIVRSEGPMFFSSDTREEGMDYLWEQMSPLVKRSAKLLIDAFVQREFPIKKETEEVIRFFGSEIRDWEHRHEPIRSPIYTYRLEYKLAQWFLVEQSSNFFHEVAGLLSRFVDAGFWQTIDFSLCTMEIILRCHYEDNADIAKSGYLEMRRWAEQFKHCPEYYHTITEHNDPYLVTFNPLAQTASVDAFFFAPVGGPISFLEEHIAGNAQDDRRMAILALRQLWRDYPAKAIGTIELALGLSDEVEREWVEKILREIYSLYPRSVEDLLRRNNIDPKRIQQIKFRQDISSGSAVCYSSDVLYKAMICSTDTRRELIGEWYKKLLDSESLDAFCQSFVQFLFHVK